MKDINRAALLAAALVLIMPLSARAEIREGSFEAGVFGGFNFFEKSQNLHNRPVFGGRLGYNITPNFGVETAVEFIHSRVEDKARTDFNEGQYRGPMDTVDLVFYHVDAVYNFIPEGPVTPYVLAGVGAAHYSPEIDTRDVAAFNLAIGAKLALSENVSMRLEFKDYIVTEIVQESYHNIGTTLGLTYMFGGKSRVASAQAARYEPAPAPRAEARPEAKPTPAVVPPRAVAPSPPAQVKVEKKVVILVSEPKVEEKIKAVVAEPPLVEPEIIVLAFEDVHFDFDKSTLKPEAQAILKRNFQILRDNPNAQIRIAGYTSASGTDEYNQKLSERRAVAVKTFLDNEGIVSVTRLTTIGYGEADPETYEAAPKELYSPAAKSNMRVLFEIVVQ